MYLSLCIRVASSSTVIVSSSASVLLKRSDNLLCSSRTCATAATGKFLISRGTSFSNVWFFDEFSSGIFWAQFTEDSFWVKELSSFEFVDWPWSDSKVGIDSMSAVGILFVVLSLGLFSECSSKFNTSSSKWALVVLSSIAAPGAM